MPVYETTRIVPFPLEQVSSFFAEPRNLEHLTPGWIRMRLIDPPASVGEGSRLRYRTAPFGFPVIWDAEITVWDPPNRFADLQVRGPYRSWEHTHTFSETEGGTAIHDRISYRLYGGPLGSVADRLGHRAILRQLFSFRTKRLVEILGAETR
ncbi:MAG: SRPBCC family protein [Actinomycetes bacterium]